MSGAEAFQVVASALAIVELSLKAYKNCATFISSAKVADITSNALLSVFERFRDTLGTVQATISHRRRQLKGSDIDIEEVRIWIHLQKTLAGWQRIMRGFKDELSSVVRTVDGIARPTWTDRLILQLKMDRKSAVIARFEATTSGHMSVITLLISCLKTIMQSNDSEKVQKKLARIERLNRDILERLRNQQTLLPTSAAPRVASQSMMSVEDMEEALAVGEGTYHKFSVYSPTTLSLADRSVKDDSEEELELSDDDAEEIVASAVRRGSELPSFDDRWPSELLDAFIKRYQIQVKVELDARRFDEAETQQRRAIRYLDERQVGYAIGYDRPAENRQLAHILKEQDRFAEADKKLLEIINTLNIPASHSVRRPSVTDAIQVNQQRALELAGDYYALADIRYREYEKRRHSHLLVEAELRAKRALKLHLQFPDTHGPEFESSVRLLMRISELENLPINAEVIQRMYLDTRQLNTTRSPPPPEDGDLPSRSNSAVSEIMTLYTAIKNDCLDDVRICLEKVPPAALNSTERKPPAILAIERSKREALQLLHAHGADMDIVYRDIPALHLAVQKGDSSLVQTLIDLGADINKSDADGRTPLMEAVRHGNTRTVEALCGRAVKPDFTLRDKDDWTVLHHAVTSNDTGLLEILLATGAPSHMVSRGHGTPLHMTVDKNKWEHAQVIMEHAVDLDVDALDEEGRSPLHLAIVRGANRHVFAKAVLEKGAKIDRNALPPKRDIHRNYQELLKYHEKQRAKYADSAVSLSSDNDRPMSIAGSNDSVSTGTSGIRRWVSGVASVSRLSLPRSARSP